MANGRPRSSVISVDPEHLRQTVALFEFWSNEAEDSEVMDGDDLHSMLDRLVRKFNINDHMAVALLKRAIALMAYCEEGELPEALFQDGLPGPQLCAAAAKVTVIDVPGLDESEMGHTLDGNEMRAALPSTWN